jgi:hypothetical protein
MYTVQQLQASYGTDTHTVLVTLLGLGDHCMINFYIFLKCLECNERWKSEFSSTFFIITIHYIIHNPLECTHLCIRWFTCC